MAEKEVDGHISSDDDQILSQALIQYEAQEKDDGIGRFAPLVSDDAVANLSEQRVPKNTRKVMNWSISAFKAWRVARNKQIIVIEKSEDNTVPWKDLHAFTNDELNYFLPRFVMEVRKQNGERYPPNSLWQMVTALQAFMRMKGRHVSLVNDVSFKPIQDALDVEMKESQKAGLGRRKQADVLPGKVEEDMWDTGVLGTGDPKTLLDTLMFTLGYYFALRASDHKNLNIDEQIKVL